MIRHLAAMLCVCLAGLSPAAAQNPFSAAVTVNDRVVTYWEVQQRTRFLQLLNAPPEALERAQDTLLDERLQVDAAERLGVSPSEEDLQRGMEEFAGRAGVDAATFIGRLVPAGVEAESFRDFVLAGLAWRNVVRSQFGARAQVSEEEVDRALALAEGQSETRARLAEIIIPLTPESEGRVRDLARELSSTLQGDTAGFGAAARQYSVARSARSGGDLGWRPLSSLPPNLQPQIVGLSPGGVTTPVELGQSIALFQLLDFEESQFVSPEANAIDYAMVAIPGGRSDQALSQARALENDLDTCDDLYGVRPDGFTREVLPADQVPADIATALIGLDANEVSTDLTTSDGALMFLMLCGRTSELPEGFREQIRQQLFNQRLESYAAGYMQELRAEAIIRTDG